MLSLKKTALLLSLSACMALAVDTEIVYSKNGRPIFELDFYNQGESSSFAGEIFTSPYTLNQAQKKEILRATQFWANILGDSATNLEPLKFVVHTSTMENNAFAASYDRFWEGNNALFADMLYNNLSKEEFDQGLVEATGLSYDDVKYTGIIGMGISDWYIAPNPSTLPTNGNQFGIFGTFTHEIMHALGVATSTQRNIDGNFMFETSSAFTRHLQDYKGVRASEDIAIIYDKGQANANNYFVVDRNTNLSTQSNPIKSLSNANGHAYFVGDNVLEVIGSATLGFDGVNAVPINGWEGDRADMSHIELDNSLMSHQNWRNYNFYMEAELAILQDIGYDFDRKQYYGDSIYESNLNNWQSTQGFNDRNEEGTAYIANTYNKSDYGVGLHIYGRSNTATQNHDILSQGIAASGIRVDGSNNTLNVNSKIHTIGAFSNALLVAYGKEHNINLNSGSELIANGIGVHINFGDNALGNNTEYRGSYMLDGVSIPSTVKDNLMQIFNLNGALVSNLNVKQGSYIEGSEAAIYIANNAFVENINIENGARIKGDIISLWDPNNERLKADDRNKFTELNFGTTPTSTPSARAANLLASTSLNFDPNKVVFDGNILGYNSLKLNINTDFNTEKSIKVYDLSLNSSASLGVDSIVEVKNDFTQASSSTLQAPINSEGKLNIFVGGNANLSGNLEFFLGKDFYNTSSIALNKAELIDGKTTSFANVSFANDADFSKFLNISYDEASSTININRDYSSLAKNTSISNSLVSLALNSSPNANVSSLFTELDFLTDEARATQALDELSSKVYLDAAKASLDFQKDMNDELVFDLYSKDIFKDDEWISTIYTFGTYNSVREDKDFSSYKSYGGGVNAKVTKSFNDTLDLGFNLILNASNYDFKRNTATLKSRGAYLGAFANVDLNNLFIFASLRAGMQNDSMNRSLNINTFSDTLKSSYNAFTTSELLGLGTNFNLSETFTLAPLAYIEHNSLSTPSIKEQGGASSLNIDKNTYHSLSSFLGLKLSYDKDFANGYGLGLSLLGGYNHFFLDNLDNEASYINDTSNVKFSSKNYVKDKDSLRVQSAIDFTHDNFYSRVLFQSDIKRNIDFNAKVEYGIRF